MKHVLVQLGMIGFNKIAVLMVLACPCPIDTSWHHIYAKVGEGLLFLPSLMSRSYTEMEQRDWPILVKVSTA